MASGAWPLQVTRNLVQLTATDAHKLARFEEAADFLATQRGRGYPRRCCGGAFLS